MATQSRYDKEELKRIAQGRWLDLFRHIGIEDSFLRSQEGPCPKCPDSRPDSTRFKVLREDEGALYCSHCLDNCGDGFRAVEWFKGWNKNQFPETLNLIGDFFGAPPKPESKKQKKQRIHPEKDLRWLDWADAGLKLWLIQHPDISLEALKAVGARRCEYRGRYVCLAIPILGKSQKPVGWALFPLSCATLPTGKNHEQKKMKLTQGSEAGFVGLLDHRLPASADQKLLKVEGITDMLMMITQTLMENLLGYLPITNAFGAGENWKPWMVQSMQDREVVVVHDCDKPGQEGAEKLVRTIGTHTKSIKNYMPPYTIKENKGEDLRDWFNSKGTCETLLKYVNQEKEIDVSKFDFRSDTDPDRIAEKIIKDHFTFDGVCTLIFQNKTWFHWDGFEYVERDRDTFSNFSRKWIVKEMIRVFQLSSSERKPDSDKSPKEVTIPFCNNVVAAMRDKCQPAVKINHGSWLDESSGEWVEKNYLALKNVVLDLDANFPLKDGADAIKKHSPRWFSTTCLPYNYDANAECPMWDKFLSTSLSEEVSQGPDGEFLRDCNGSLVYPKISKLQEWAGYGLMAKKSKQKFLMLQGEGANGKSVYITGLKALYGEGNYSTVSLADFGEKFALYDTVGMRANFDSDCDDLSRVSEGNLKKSTGSDAMQVQKKRGDPFSVELNMMLVVCINNRPRFRDQSGALWRRLDLVMFNIHIYEKDRIEGMTDRTWWARQGELPGMLNWALEGATRLRLQKTFTVSPGGEKEKEDFKIGESPVRRFVDEQCVLDNSGKRFIKKTELFSHFKSWLDLNNHAAMNSNKFKDILTRTFSNVKEDRPYRDGNRQRCYMGICLKTDEYYPPEKVQGQW